MQAIETKSSPSWKVNLTGMLVFLASEAFLFGSLFFSYFYLKINNSAWPPSGITLDTGLASINTAVLLTSSLMVYAASRAIRRGRTSMASAALLLSAVMGAAFIGITLWEWSHESFRPWDSSYGAIFYTLTGFHALHVLGGVMVLLALFIRTERGHYSISNTGAIEVGSLYWHYVDAIWILVFLTLFIVR